MAWNPVKMEKTGRPFVKHLPAGVLSSPFQFQSDRAKLLHSKVAELYTLHETKL